MLAELVPLEVTVVDGYQGGANPFCANLGSKKMLWVVVLPLRSAATPRLDAIPNCECKVANDCVSRQLPLRTV
jgi:hypothetical protein